VDRLSPLSVRTPAWGVASLVLVALLATLAAGLVGGVFEAGAIADAGAAVRVLLPVTGVLGNLAVATTVGGLLAAAFLLPADADRSRALTTAAVAAGTWTLVALVDLFIVFADVLGARLGEGDVGELLGSFMRLPLGRVLAAVVVVAAVVTVLALLVETPTGSAWLLGLVAAAVALVSLTGHTSGADNHRVAVSAMFLHLAGAAAWLGPLVVLAVLRVRGGLTATLPVVVARYSRVALWCYVVVGVSGFVSAWVRVGSLDALGTAYGALVLTKVVLLVLLGVLGWAHRRGLSRRLAAADGPHRWVFWRLAAVELAAMGAVSGVAAALAGTSPPVPDEAPAAPTPAQVVTGEPLPPEQTGASWFAEWRPDVLMLLVVVAGVLVYVRWHLRLRARGDRWSGGRTASWLVGMAILAWVTSGGPAVYGHVLFSAHMVQHMVLAMVIPIFLVMAAPVTLALRALPARKDGSRGPREWLLVLVHSRWGRFFAHPGVAAANFAGSMMVFYYSGLFELSLTTHVGHLAMIAHFSLAGYLFANALIGIDPGPQRPGYPQRLLLLFATMAFHAFFGVTLVTSESLMVADWFGLLGRPWGDSAIVDQQLGGSIAWGIGEIPTMLLAIVVAVRWAKDDERTATRRDRRVERSGDTELDDYNAMLARLAERD
jgi:cytochrome c oxidase assembly factor CtaG/putative copper export protein